jgi:hypothetical protein
MLVLPTGGKGKGDAFHDGVVVAGDGGGGNGGGDGNKGMSRKDSVSYIQMMRKGSAGWFF